MNAFFAAIEQSSLGIWMREGEYAYFIALILHAFGMALLVGGGIVVSLCVLGVGGGASLPAVRGFFPVMKLGALLAIVSGGMLLAGYPAKALTNPVFAIKFACLIGATLLVRWLSSRVLTTAARVDWRSPSARKAAIAALLLWLGAVAAGKLLLHTYTVLTVSD